MKYLKQLTIILLVSFLAELLEYLIPLPIAASVYGLILMFLGLVTHIIPLHAVEDTADFLVDNMSVMFIPATVGIISCVEELKKMAVPLLAACLVTTVLIMAVTGRTAQFVIRHFGKKKATNTDGEEDEG